MFVTLTCKKKEFHQATEELHFKPSNQMWMAISSYSFFNNFPNASLAIVQEDFTDNFLINDRLFYLVSFLQLQHLHDKPELFFYIKENIIVFIFDMTHMKYLKKL